MDLPSPPKDSGLRNIIDKLAEFVARNGPEFEAITKAKQQDNPKFEFLYGGEFYLYYKWRVQTEQAILKQQGSISQAQNTQHHQQQQQQHLSPSGAGGNGNGTNNIQRSSNILSQMWNNNGPSPTNVNSSGGSTSGMGSNQNVSVTNPQIDAINVQQIQLREQIMQSEQNLSAQHGVLLQQQQVQTDEAILKAQNETLMNQADANNIPLTEFDAILQPIIDSCTKDSISTGKNWILQHTTDPSKCNVILQYLLKKALVNGAPFTQKLHLIYLVNDILHHCVRKRADDLKNNLENIVIPMFCSSQIIASTEQKAKLIKLLSLWESKANFFDACVISKLRSPVSSMQEYKTNLMNTHTNVVSQISQTTKATFENYKQQHQAFVLHATQKIAMLETQKQTLIEQQANVNQIPPLLPPGVDSQQPISVVQNQKFQSTNNSINNGTNVMPPNSLSPSLISNINRQSQQQQQSNIPPPLMSQNVAMPLMSIPTVKPLFNSNNSNSNNSTDNISNFQNPEPPSSHFNQSQQTTTNNASGNSSSYPQPPPSFLIPDLSKPPPGFSLPQQGSSSDAMLNNVDITSMSLQTQEQQQEIQQQQLPPQQFEEVKPTISYYELPAGLMVPLIRLEDYRYKPLNPDDLRLPPPIPPSERLLSAIEAFYSMPCHDRPRDAEGWEKLGLYEYYKVKRTAKKTKEEDIIEGLRERSRSPTPIIIEIVKPIKPNKRRYRSKSRSKSRSRSPKSPLKLSTSGTSGISSRNDNPNRDVAGGGSGNRENRKNRGGRRWSKSPKKSSPARHSRRSPSSPPTPSLNQPRRERDRGDRDRNKDRDTSSVSPPPSFFAGNYAKSSNECIEESNKGHQMLMKMGWAGSGTGLGTHGQGIDTPISGGEVRDKQDQFKGIGINLNDPYENFRKNKGAAFIHRMRSRDSDRKT